MESILAHLRLQQYKQTFQKHNVDFVAFLEMNEQSLKNIGIKNDQHINTLISCVGKLKAMLLATLSGQTSPTTILESREETKLLDELYLFETMKFDLSSIEDFTRANDELSVQSSNQVVTQYDNGAATMARHQLEQSSASNTHLPDLPSAKELTEPSTIAITIHSENIPNNERLSITRFTRLRRNTLSTSDDITVVKNQTRQSVLTLAHDPPPSYDAVEQSLSMIPIYSDQEDGLETLPPYSCTVEKKGYVAKKNEMTSHHRSNDRSWKKCYIHLCGTLLNIYKNEPTNVKHANPLQQLSMDGADISLATNYSKRKNVIRIKFSNGHQFLLQTSNRGECVNWVETLQTAVNISSTIDDRKMPQFITAPNRRRQAYGYYAEMIRELQQVSFDELDETIFELVIHIM